MSKKRKTIVWSVLLVVVVTSGTLALLSARTGTKSDKNYPAVVTGSTAKSQNQRPSTPPGQRSATRNLALQPEAFKMSRKLGKRFMSSSSEESVLIGTLITGTEHQPIRIRRQQNDRGEKVELAFGGGPASLSWNDEDGPRGAGRGASDSERTLIERLAFDSIDQFVLAQLRGASYYTVAHNAMPAEAGGADNYSGPVWDIIRVDDPEADPQKQPLSKWRLYYINSQTGLIDKVVSQVRGERIETNFAAWTDQAGERVPSRITWTRDGQTLMEFRLNNFARNSK
jgi:hypothetical protein